MQRTIRPIATAQARYASGAAGPSAAAAPAGSRKRPRPPVTLTIAAASPKVPMARSSGAGAAWGGEDADARSIDDMRGQLTLMLCFRAVPPPTRDECLALDRADALAPLRAQFAL